MKAKTSCSGGSRGADEPLAVAEDVHERARDKGVGDAASGELAAGRVLVTPTGLGEDERRLRELLDGHGPTPRIRSGARMDDFEPRDRSADLEPVAVDGQGDQAGLGADQPPGVGELEPAPGAHEQRDAELGLEVGDLLGDAGAGEVERVRRAGERAVLGGGEEVGQLLQRHCRRSCLRLHVREAHAACSIRLPRYPHSQSAGLRR